MNALIYKLMYLGKILLLSLLLILSGANGHKNIEFGKNKRETQFQYFGNKFQDLLEIILIQKTLF